MTKPTNPKIFITGIPTAGKSYLAKKIVKETGGFCLETDNLREELAKNHRYRKWAKFFEETDKLDYFDNDPEEQWRILDEQHEKLWPGVLEKIREYENGKIPLKSEIAAHLRKPMSKKRPIVFEGIGISPRFAQRDLDFPGVVLVGKSFEDVLENNRRKPRWGETEELIKKAAEAFWFTHRPHYITEAESCGYRVFEDADEAYREIVKMLKLK